MKLFSTTVLFLPFLHAGELVCLFFSVLIIMYYSAEDHHGCLVKEQRLVGGVNLASGVKLWSITSSNVEDCSEACAERSDCDSFSVDKGKTCRLYRKGTIFSRGSVSSATAGFCPKGILSMAAQTNLYNFLTLTIS